jgi:Icc-related predicted phosphoesterase
MNDGTSYTLTNKDIKNIIDLIKPNFIVITGDIVDPSILKNYEEHHKNSMQAILDANIPWMWTGGSNI